MINEAEIANARKKRIVESRIFRDVKKPKRFKINCSLKETNLKETLVAPIIQLNAELGTFLNKWPTLINEQKVQKFFLESLNIICFKFETLKQIVNCLIRDSSSFSCAVHLKTLEKRFLRLLGLFFSPLIHFLLKAYRKSGNTNWVLLLLKSLNLKNLDRNYKTTTHFIVLNAFFWTWVPSLRLSFCKKIVPIKEKQIQCRTYSPFSSKHSVARVPVKTSLINGPFFFKKKKLFPCGNNFCSPKQKAEYLQRIPQNVGPTIHTMLHQNNLSIFMKYGLFKNKTVLEIGCHTGQTAFGIAMHCEPCHIVGQDIDVQLIEYCLQQVRDWKYHCYYQLQQKRNNAPVKCESTTGAKNVSRCIPLLSMQDLLEDKTVCNTSFPFNISFLTEDVVKQLNDRQETYDTILAFSVTKWLHLQNGDTVLKKTFQNIVKRLHSGGFFVLQPQSWESYKRNYSGIPQYKSQRHQIYFKPHHFDTYLQKELHLTRVAIWQDDTNRSCIQTYFLYQKNHE
ncbi:uncharacterized protein LOC128883631 [Hylaeus volcanicus]|uniref:uncharacterized protein LOC128883631 n=1 Tax=Hylaeus volcanicus TaxID=313075 RepID=UPI0023B7DAC5|nr:uncharacterized protein LOC128883631 [Hylaeus volcanicus]